MQRRKARDPMDSLELGNQLSLSASIPMRKLTKMKVVKYLILFLIALLIHTAYRLLWKAQDNVSEIQNESYQDHIDSKNSFQDSQVYENSLNDDVRQDEQNFGDSGVNEVNNEDRNMNKLAEKIERYENFKEVIERAKEEVHVEEVVDAEKLIELEHSDKVAGKLAKPAEEVKKENQEAINVLEQIVVADDKRREVMELEKEHKIESKIAEILEEVRSPDDAKVEEKPIERKNVVLSDNAATFPAPDQTFLKKADMVMEKLAAENKFSMVKVQHTDHKAPELVTAATSKQFEAVKQLVYSVQKFFPKEKIYIFDLDLTEPQRRHLMAACNVRIREFWSNLFPKFVSDWDHYHWRPLIIQTALAEFGHIIWINPGQVVSSMALLDAAKETSGSIRVFGQSQIHTTFAVTNPSMYKYLPTDRKKLYTAPHMEIFGLILHNTQELNEKFVKLLVACSMEPKCMAPEGSQWRCDFDFSGKRYADCHRYDESAMNIILKNWFDYDNASIMRNPTVFKPYNAKEKMALKMCRDENDMSRRHNH